MNMRRMIGTLCSDRSVTESAFPVEMMDRKTLLALLGKSPVKPELALELIEEVDCGAYVRRKVSYLVESGERISAYLCVPTVGSGPFTAVYCFHQHGSNRLLSKSEVVGLAGSSDQVYEFLDVRLNGQQTANQ